VVKQVRPHHGLQPARSDLSQPAGWLDCVAAGRAGRVWVHSALVLRQPMHMGERGVQSYAHTIGCCGYCSACISMHRDTAPVSRDWDLPVFSTARCSVEHCMSAQRTLYSRTHDLKCYTRSQPGQSHPCGPSQEAHTALRRCVAESHLVSAHYVPPAGAHRTWQRRGSIRWSQRPASLTLQRQPQLRYSPHL
jgi:hypothetical protein